MSPTHHTNFSPSWIWRDVVDVAVITPAVGLGVVDAELNTTAFGVAKFARFRRLKNSARNCRLTRSEIAVFFSSDASSSASPGPTSTFLPTFPYVPLGGTTN